MDDAKKRVKQLAASALARRDGYQDSLDALEAEKKEREQERALALDAGDDALALQLSTIIQELEVKLEDQRGAVAEADTHYQEILGELKNLQQAEEDYERARLRAPVDAALTPDPFAQSPADVALENVRSHIETLAARADLEDELAPRRDRDLERKIAALEKQEAEAKAKAQLAELKAKRKREKEAAEGSSTPASKPKKTL